MLPGRRARASVLLIAATLVVAMLATACSNSGIMKKEYEYEEEVYLALDGSATVNINASVASLVALHGVDLPIDPRARLDRARVRALFVAEGVDVPRVSLSRRDGRRYVHLSIDVPALSDIRRVAPLAWSSHQFERQDEIYEYRQVVGPPTGQPVTGVGWNGGELVAFRMHLPSKILFHNAPSKTVERGNILEWEQLLSERQRGTPLELQVQIQTQSILSRTLLLFGSTILAAALTFAVIVWWVARRRGPAVAESRP